MIIEVLYFRDCPNYLPAIARVREALQAERVSAEISRVEVPDSDAAKAIAFLGSPTIRINGVDVEPSARSGGIAGLCCRTYADDHTTRDGAPSTELIRGAIRELGARSTDDGA